MNRDKNDSSTIFDLSSLFLVHFQRHSGVIGNISLNGLRQVMQDNTSNAPRRRRGRRIKQTAWPGILKLYQDGATLTAIARIYDCTPSAICYIVKKAERIYGDLTQFSKGEPIEGVSTAGWSAPRPMMMEGPHDAWSERMLNASRICLRSYRNWRHDNNPENTLSLDMAVREMHIVLARLEMEMVAVSGEEATAPQTQP